MLPLDDSATPMNWPYSGADGGGVADDDELLPTLTALLEPLEPTVLKKLLELDELDGRAAAVLGCEAAVLGWGVAVLG